MQYIIYGVAVTPTITTISLKEREGHKMTNYNETIKQFKETDNGRFGKALEINVKMYLNGNRGNSDRVSAKGKNDVKHKGKIFEIKSNCGELNNIEKNDYIIYSMDNEKDFANPDSIYVFTPEDFLYIMETCGLVRRKKTTGGYTVKAIQSYRNSKKKSAMLAEMLETYAINYLSAFK